MSNMQSVACDHVLIFVVYDVVAPFKDRTNSKQTSRVAADWL